MPGHSKQLQCTQRCWPFLPRRQTQPDPDPGAHTLEGRGHGLGFPISPLLECFRKAPVLIPTGGQIRTV